MTQEIGSLAVRLSLDANNFNGTISQVNQNMRAMGSELQAIRAHGQEYEQSLEGMRRKQDVLQRTTDAASLKLQEQRRRYDELVASGNATEAQLARQANAVNQAQAQYTRLNRELLEVTEAIEDATNRWKQAETAISGFGERATAVGGKMKDIGGTLTASVTAPLLAFGAGAIAVATQFDTAQAKIQGQLGITAEEAQKLSDVAQSVWKKGFGEDIVQVTSDLAILKQYLGDVGEEDLSNLLESSYTLQELFGAEIQESARTASVMMKTFGIDGQQAMDLITTGFQRGGDFSGELLDTLREYAPQFKALGYDAEAFTAILIAGAESGAFNLDKLGDVAKESFLRIGDGSKASREALSDLGLDFKQIETDINSGGETANSAFAAVASAIAMVKDPAEKSALAIALMGTPIEDLGPEFQNFFANVSTELEGFEGAASKASETLQQSFGERLQSTWRTAQESLLPLGETLLDIAEDWLPRISAGVETATGWFNDLSPSAQNATLAIGGIVAIAGPAVMGIGMIASGIGAISGVIAPVVGAIGGFGVAAGTAGASAGVLGTAIGVLSGPIGIAAVLGIAAIGTAAVVTAKEMSESSIQIADWSKGVSEATAEAVGGFVKISDDVGQSLSQLHLTSTTITDEMAAEMTSKFDAMHAQIVEGANTKHEEQMESLRGFFANSSALTSDEEAKILEKRQQAHQTELEILAAKNKIVADIMQKASDEKRELTDHERKVINNINEQMKEDAVRVLSESEVEQKVILEKMKADASELSALQAAEVVKNAVKQKEKVVEEANKQYEEAIANITRLRDETGDISAEQAERMIAEAQKSRDTTIKYAEEMHENIVSEAKAQAGEHVDQVNWETGEVKSKWEVMKTDVSQKMKKLGSDIKRDWTQAYNDARKSVSDMKDSVTSKFTEMRTSVETKMTEVKTKIKTKWNEAETFLTSIDLKAIGKDIVQGLVNGINEKIDGVVTAAKNLGRTVIDSVSNVLQRRSPARELIYIGHDVGEGLAIGIEDKKTRVANVMKDMANNLLDISDHYKDEEKKITEKANAQITKIEKRTQEDIEKIQRAATSKKRQLTQDENLKIQRLQEDAVAKIAEIEKKATYDSVALIAKAQKDKLEEIKLFIQDKKSLEELTLVEEALLWQQSLDQFDMYTKERVEAQKAYQAAVDAINKEITTINTNYSNQIQKINEDLIKQEETLTKAYADAVDKRAQSLVSFKGLFDAFKVEIDVTGEQLIANLGTQVEGFKAWQTEVEKLSERAIDKGLLEELRQMGPNALPQLVALNKLTDQQLQQYSNLYQEKARLARTQAETELKGMKDDTDKQITALREAANKQLVHLQREWHEKIKTLTQTTSTELSSLRQVGRDAGQGLLEGLSSMQGPLQAKAQSIADSISSTIRSALQVRSPSRLTRKIGVNVGEGLVLGMDDMASKVAGAAQRLASTVEGNVSASSSTSINKSRTYNGGETHIHVYGNNPSPSEIARKALQVERQRAMEWGIA
ncbi:phage tail tape measure protein [Lysinibacillus sp. KU-BSD001]|uniref:phage tail tape measure protein n=1 Tax=Lysinibacillus sp. KU-BSD001 TaxID=3141328 RepID=UPI0036ECF80D